MSWGSGLPYWYIGPGPACHIIDNAIVSRYPLYNQSRYVIPPSWVKPECYPIPTSSEILEAWVDINGSPHRFFTTHWDSLKTRWEVTEARTESANILSRDLITRNNTVAFYGGDLNECRPSSAALCGGSAAQGTSVGLLLTVTSDPLTELLSRYGSGTGRVSNCDPAPIDDVFYRNSTFADPSGPVYETVEYTSDCRNNSPSDHPFVRVAFYRER